MANNVLIAFDDSENAVRAVTFVASHFTRDSSIMLFSVIPDSESICAMNSPEPPHF